MLIPILNLDQPPTTNPTHLTSSPNPLIYNKKSNSPYNPSLVPLLLHCSISLPKIILYPSCPHSMHQVFSLGRDARKCFKLFPYMCPSKLTVNLKATELICTLALLIMSLPISPTFPFFKIASHHVTANLSNLFILQDYEGLGNAVISSSHWLCVLINKFYQFIYQFS